MRILADKNIKTLFFRMLACILAFILLSLSFIAFGLEHAAIYILFCSGIMGIMLMAVCYLYFREQDKIMEEAVSQITEYISGNHAANIECDEEGELYRLFHEVNSLAAILNAHAENEGRSKRFLKETISNISHQLKTPLAALNIYNGLLQDETEDIETVKKLTTLSEQELDRIERLVQNLLKITKLDADAITFEKSPEKVADMIKDVGLSFAYRAKQEHKEIRLSGDDNILLCCDRSWIMEAIGNIVKNALDHTKEGDCISIEWKEFPSVIRIKIRDNGSGIHPEDLHHIFKQFYRSRFSKDTQGMGLGLPLAKAIIEAHDGTIEVDSELGTGTVFLLNFLIPTKL